MNRTRIMKKYLLPVLLFLAMAGIGIAGFSKFERLNREQELALTKQEIKKAAVQCYANEGMYPSEISYLEENYYLTIDYEKYYVIYECTASNFMPDVEVYRRGRR